VTSLPWGPSDRTGLSPLDGGITATEGVRAAGVTSGVKPSGRPDLALIATDAPAATAVVTTTNLVKAPSCRLTERHAEDGRASAVVINSGNANVCTPRGDEHTQRLADTVSGRLGVSASDVLVMSTGVIGVPLPVERIEAAVPSLVDDLAADGGHRAAEAMLTTDTHAKQVAYRVTDEQGGTCTVAGMAKGVGMIEPAMATLLVVLATDAPLGATVLRRVLRQSVRTTFNRISIDGDGSTSDTVAMLATGAAPHPPGLAAITRATEAVCADLALAVVSDGEGASRVAAITVHGAPTEAEAEAVARAVATSLLVRAAIHGADPNWGRILMSMGNAGVDFDPGRVSVACGGITVCRFGVAASFDRGNVAAAMQRDEVEIDIDLAAGEARATMLTCDLTPEYVRFNAEYTT
jgi:glutamate N-acetyltransferase / amino-acid N-acetyltransferase